MAWEAIENVKQAGKPRAFPPMGVVVKPRQVGLRGGGAARYIALKIGGELMRALGTTQAEVTVDLMLGSGAADAGKVGVVLKPQGGGFRAKRLKCGNYLISISVASAEGLFSLDFPELRVAQCDVINLTATRRMFTFRASAEMLETGDD